MKYLLDSNACIRHLNRRSDAVTRRLLSLSDADIAVCSVVKAELYYGAARSQQPQQTLRRQKAFLSRFTSLPFDDTAADHYARIRADLTKQGTPIGPNDLMIAAIALSNNLILVTHNTSEFGHVAGLQLEDWETDS